MSVLDTLIARLAGRQRGVVARWQLLALGDLVRESGLPLPQLNVLAEGYLVDAYWPGARLVVELQGYEHHAHRQAFDRDYGKLARLRLAGYEVLPFTYRQVRDDPEWVVDAVRALLDRARLGARPAHSAAAAPAH